MSRILRFVLVVTGLVSLAFAVGFFAQAGWATRIWPLASSRLSNIFIASILAAIGAPVLWIGLSGELRAMAGGAINLAVTNAGFALSMFLFYLNSGQTPLLLFGIVSLAMTALTIALYFYSIRFRFADNRPTPLPVRISFVVFAPILLVTAILLLLRRPNIFPWPLSSENSIMYGWIFLGAMCYFLYGLAIPRWGNTRGQLIGFLAYDVVLIAPFIAHFRSVQPQMLLSLSIYTTVVTLSGLLAIYYLFIYPETRFSFRMRATLPAAP